MDGITVKAFAEREGRPRKTREDHCPREEDQKEEEEEEREEKTAGGSIVSSSQLVPSLLSVVLPWLLLLLLLVFFFFSASVGGRCWDRPVSIHATARAWHGWTFSSSPRVIVRDPLVERAF